MSGFLSSEAEAALLGEEHDARELFYQHQAENARLAGLASGSAYQQDQWRSAYYPGMSSAQSQIPAQAFTAPAQLVSWPRTEAMPTFDYTGAQYQASSTPVVPSTPYSNAHWPMLHPDDIEAPSDISRSVSPNPADLRNFGVSLPDGRSWRCAYPNCTSQAIFTRGCDLRKHFRRHTKSLFCSHEDCPQSNEGGFSSRKDLARHEARHAPAVPCSHPDCERVFSRVDNMNDHVRRIHGKKSS